MSTSREDLKDRLARYHQIEISVVGRKSRRIISMPVWFVMEGDDLYLLPVRGSHTQWYQNVIHDPFIRISVRGQDKEFRCSPVVEPKAVLSIVAKFRNKYGPRDVKKYYSNFDVAVLVKLT